MPGSVVLPSDDPDLPVHSRVRRPAMCHVTNRMSDV